MDASKGLLLKSDSGENERIASLLEEHKPQEVWISDEEFYTEGSSDEDDMALRIKRRERREAKREKSTGIKAQISSSESRLVSEKEEIDLLQNISTVQDSDDSHKWRPTRGSIKLKNIVESEQSQLPSSSKEHHNKEPCSQ